MLAHLPFIEVSQFSTDFLESVISVVTDSPLRSSTSRKDHILYLSDYLKKIDTETVVLEGSYTDKNYLEDYQQYYSSCFPNHPKCCTRLHFFSSIFDESEFLQIIENPEIVKEVDFSLLSESYLGFIVIRPIPETFIARLCLKSYKTIDIATDEYFLIQKENPVRLFGLNFTVKGVPFTEKDKVVSACATSSIWVLLNSSPYYEKKIPPSPGEITKSALSLKTLEVNSFSVLGLEPYEVHRTINSYGLLARDIKFLSPNVDDNAQLLKRYSEAYLTNGIPYILAGTIYRVVKDSVGTSGEDVNIEALDNGRQYVEGKLLNPIGEHAVCVLGYKKNKQKNSMELSDRIETLYAHDDRYGPYLALKFNQDAYKVATKNPYGRERRKKIRTTSGLSISFEKQHSEGCELYEVFVPERIFLANHQQIRTNYDDIQSLVKVFFDICFILNSALPEQKELLKGNFFEGLRYKIQLSNSCDFKEKVRDKKSGFFSFNAEEGKLSAFICKTLPDHIWVASIYSDDSVVGELLFDASEIIQGRPIIGYIAYTKEFNLLWFLLSKEEVYSPLCSKIGEAVDDKIIGVDYFNLLNLYIKFIQESSRLFLNLLYGQAKIAYRPFRMGNEKSQSEVDSVGKVYKKPEVQIIKFESSWRAKVLNKSFQYIWLINEDGDLYYGIEINDPESPYSTGHTTLNDGRTSRLAGELSYNRSRNCWTISLDSGAYSKHIMDESAQKKYLERVVEYNFKGWEKTPEITFKR